MYRIPALNIVFVAIPLTIMNFLNVFPWVWKENDWNQMQCFYYFGGTACVALPMWLCWQVEKGSNSLGISKDLQ